jgi:two-component system, chemotaxis family, CheB/CheR fusion protein
LATQRGTACGEQVRVASLMDDALALFQRRIRAVGLKVVKQFDYDGAVVGTAGELRQVFSNLIANAMDALSVTGDRLVLRVRTARRWDTGVIGVRASIFDNGNGIAPEHRDRLFQGFHTTKGDQGTGIGLWVSKRIIDQHGGTLHMRTSVKPGNSGTCFSIFLPFNKAAEEAPRSIDSNRMHRSTHGRNSQSSRRAKSGPQTAF